MQDEKANKEVTLGSEKSEKHVYVIRRSIFYIFVFFSVIVMLINFGFIVFGLCFNKLLAIIDGGFRPPTMINFAIMSEAGSTISFDAMAQSHNDLLILKAFAERILQDTHSSKRQLADTDLQTESDPTSNLDKADQETTVLTAEEQTL